MKRILFALFLAVAGAGFVVLQPATTYAASATPVTTTAFNTKVNLLDAQIAAGNMTAAAATWNEVHDMMLSVLATSKEHIQSAATPAAKTAAESVLSNQVVIYQAAWNLKQDMATNRAALHAKLGEFAATI